MTDGNRTEPLLNYYGISNRGRIRKINQDALLTPSGQLVQAEGDSNEQSWQSCAGSCGLSDKAQVFLVCDGMGGESFGEEAARLAVENFRLLENIAEPAADYHQRVRQAVLDCNEIINAEATKRDVARIGATFVLLWLQNGSLGMVNIGDSRAYLWRGGQLRQLTRDHTQVATYVAAGLITPEQARIHPHRHRLSQYLGIDTQEIGLSPYFVPLFDDPQQARLQPGDRLLLCSDGLTELVEDDELAKQLAAATDAEACCRALVHLAWAAGAEDNITVLTLFATDAAAAEPADVDAEAAYAAADQDEIDSIYAATLTPEPAEGRDA